MEIQYCRKTNNNKIYNHLPLNEYINLIKQSHDYAIYEVMNNRAGKIHFTIRILFEQPNSIYKIINDFIKFMKNNCNIEINDYVLLYNNTKLCYRIIFYEYFISDSGHIKYMYKLLKLLENFIYENPIYGSYISCDFIEIIAVNQIDRFNNKYTIINENENSVENSIITNVTNSKLINPEIKDVKIKLWKPIDTKTDNEILKLIDEITIEPEFINKLKSHYAKYKTFSNLKYDDLINILKHMQNPIFKSYEYYLQFNSNLTKSKYEEMIKYKPIFIIDDYMNINCINCVDCYCCINCINCIGCYCCINCNH